MSSTETVPVSTDSPESRRYNRIKRWIGVADVLIGFGLLVAILATGWTGTLRDIALGEHHGVARNYSIALFLYLLMLTLISKAIGLPLEYYGFRLEHRYHLSNQRLRSWLIDEFKGLLVGLLLATDCGGIDLLFASPGAAVLVADCVGRFYGTVRPARATRAYCPVSRSSTSLSRLRTKN